MINRKDDGRAPKITTDGSDNNASGPTRSGGGNNNNGENNGGNISDSDSSKSDDEDSNSGSLDLPTNGWEEFDEDAIYQKKHVDPEMRQWVLTNDCRRTISNEFFNNPVDERGACNPFLKKGSNYIICS